MTTRTLPTTSPPRPAGVPTERSRLAAAEATLATADADVERCEIAIWARGGIGCCSNELVLRLFAAHEYAYRATLDRNHAAQRLADAITHDATGGPQR